jgi:hypothetical protein
MKKLTAFLREDRLLLLFCLLSALLARILFVMTREFLFDDAYITYQFARNLVQGHGFSFNPGEVVYGSSSPLYTFLAAAVAFLWSPDVLPGAMRWVGTLCLLASVAVLWLRMPVNRESRIVLAIMLLGYPRIFYSSLGGLEEGLIILLMVCSYVALAKKSEIMLGVTLGLLFMAKFDTIVWIVCIVLSFALARRRFPWKALLVGAAVSIPWILYGVASFGSIVPHTVEAKHVAFPAENRSMASVLLLLPVPDGVRGSLLVCVIADLFVYSSLGLAGWQCVSRKEWDMLPFPLYCILYLAALLISDMPLGLWSRWITPMWAAVFVSFAYSLDRLLILRLPGPRRMPIRWIWGAAILFTGVSLTIPFLYPNQVELDLAPNRETGTWLVSHSRPYDSILLEPIGAIGYMSGLHVHDFIGLVSPDVTEARKASGFSNRWFLEYIRRKNPTFVVLRNSEFEKNEFIFGGYNDGVFTGDENRWFQNEYRQVFRNHGFSEIGDLVVYRKIRS